MAEKRQTDVAVHHESHGNSVAAWTAVGIIALGFLIGTAAVVAKTPLLYVIGGVVIVIGAITGKVLSAMGFGVTGKPGH
jgi:hypothetical protein